MSNLIERLRRQITVDGLPMPGTDVLHHEAADEIEILIEYKKVSDSEAALAEAEIKHLEDALRLYGEHNPECGCWDKMDSGQLFARHDWQCTCGFREALDKEQT